MKRWTLFFLVFVAIVQSCGYKQKEAQLVKRERQIAEKEQILIRWEQRLRLLEQKLQAKEKQQQNSNNTTDSLQANSVTGKWIVKMQCTETNCSGSAIGDSKAETWEIAYHSKGIVVNAFAGNSLSRIYNGSFVQNRLEIVSNMVGSESVVRVMLELNENKMDGMREVDRNDCKIRYSLSAERQK